MKKMGKVLAVLATTALMANASPVALVDGSLESGFVAYGASSPSGWYTWAAGTQDAASGENLTGSGFFAAMTPLDGTSGAFLTSSSLTDGASMYQQVTLTAGQEYKLTIALGSNTAGSGTKDDALFGVVIYDSGFALKASTTGTVAANLNTFTDHSVTWTADATGTYNVGLRNLGYVAGTGADDQSALFADNVRLDAIPEPATLGLVAVFGVGVLFFRRKLMI